MKKLIYAGDTFMTGDDIADAVLRFGRALARHHDAETIQIPAVRLDGTPVTVSLLIGPASQIVAEDAPEIDDEVVDEEVALALNRRAHDRENLRGGPIDTFTEEWLDDI